MRFGGQALLAGIMDNPLTRSWADTIGRRVVTPLERLTMDDEALRTSLGRAAGNYVVDGAVTPELLERVKMAAAAGGLPAEAGEIYGQAMKMGEPLAASEVAGTVKDLLEKADRQKLVAIERQMLGDPIYTHTDAGGAAQFLLGNPVAAYGAVAGGGALGAMGVMELARRIQEMQQDQQV